MDPPVLRGTIVDADAAVEPLATVRGLFAGLDALGAEARGYVAEPACAIGPRPDEAGGYLAARRWPAPPDPDAAEPSALLLDGRGVVVGVLYEGTDAPVGPSRWLLGYQVDFSPPQPVQRAAYEALHAGLGVDWTLRVVFAPDGAIGVDAWNPRLACPEGLG